MQQDITDTENELSENNPPIFTEAQAAYKDEEVYNATRTY